ncbi:MFS transporter [Mycobacterium riyadhense]|uniref:MFS transporter n=1 Tax=Mycobacterium riyadhense TaxID=486698 RepID=UPI0019528B7F|nr:MFS transporter [Mycobacterium riyadhense]
MTVQTVSTVNAPPVIDAGPAGPGRRGRGRRTTPLTRRRQPSPASVLLVAAFGAFLAFLDSTIVNVAFPDIQRYFHSGISDLSWVLNAYNIVFAAFLVAAGKLADLLGRKRVFLYGVVLFTIASGLCAVADSVGELVAFRVLQGISAAVLVPASLGLVVEAFPAERRAHGVNLWGAAGAIAAGLGPPIGGALVEAWGWRWVFLVNLPLGVVAVLAARRALVESRASGRRRVPDVRGAALLAIALGLLTLGLIKGPDWGWDSPAASGSLVAAAVAMVGFVASSRNHPAPLVEPALLRIRSFVAGSGLTAVASAGFYAYLLTHVLFLKYVWGYTLLQAGLAVAPAAFVAAVVAGLLGRVADRHGYRVIIGVGALIWAGSLLWYLERVGSTPNFLGEWLPGQLLQGIGVGATLPLLSSAALAGLAAGGSYATASAVIGAIRQVGAVIGIALLVVLIGTPTPGQAEEALRRGWAMAAICFVAVGIAAVLLGRVRQAPAEAVEPQPAREPAPPVAPVRPQLTAPTPAAPVPPMLKASHEFDLLQALRFARPDAQEVELQAGSYLFRAGDMSDALYVVRRGRLQVLAGGGEQEEVVAELGRGQVVGELGVLLNAPRSATVRAVRDSTLTRLTKPEFDKIADAGVLAALAGVLAKRQHQTRVAAQRTTPEVVVAVVGVDASAPVAMVATELCAVLSTRLRAVAPGRVDRDGLERAEQAADRVVIHAAVDDAQWRDFCLRVADRVVLVASDPAPRSAPLAARATGADLVLAGPAAGREQRRAWEELITPRSVHTVRGRTVADDLQVLAARIAGRSIGLVLGGGAARACAHLGVLEELEAAGVTIDRFAGTSMGAIIAALAASGRDAAAVDAQIYEHFVRKSHGDYTLPSKGLIRGKRTRASLRMIFGDQLVEELPKHFRCVSVDLLARQPVVHRRGLLADVIGCSMRLPFLYAPMPYNGTLHVDGGVLDNVPVTTLVGKDGPLIAVNVAAGGNPNPASSGNRRGKPRVPGLTDTLLRTMTISSAMASEAVLAQADLVIKPNPIGVGLMEYHQIDRAREAGRIAAREALPQIMELVHR